MLATFYSSGKFQITQQGDNFDIIYCNKIDPKDESTYEISLNKINEDMYFENFYFDLKTSKDEKYFELDGENFTFVNVHEQQLLKRAKSGIKNPSMSNISTNLLINKFNDNVTSINHTAIHVANRSFSVVIHKKLKF